MTIAKPICGNCRFWSQMCAKSDGNGLEALCLGDGAPRQGKFTQERFSCGGWKENTIGNIDDPPDYGERVRAEYERVEGSDACKAARPA